MLEGREGRSCRAVFSSRLGGKLWGGGGRMPLSAPHAPSSKRAGPPLSSRPPVFCLLIRRRLYEHVVPLPPSNRRPLPVARLRSVCPFLSLSVFEIRFRTAQPPRTTQVLCAARHTLRAAAAPRVYARCALAGDARQQRACRMAARMKSGALCGAGNGTVGTGVVGRLWAEQAGHAQSIWVLGMFLKCPNVQIMREGSSSSRGNRR